MKNPFTKLPWYEILIIFLIVLFAFKGIVETFFGCNSVISYWTR